MKNTGKIIIGGALSVLIAGMLIALVAFRNHEENVYSYDYENILGTSFQLKVFTNDETLADRAEQCALDEIDRLEGILSTYDPTSEVSKWLATKDEPVWVSDELYEVLNLFDWWSRKSEGALNASVAISSDLWKQAAAAHALPSQETLVKATEAMREKQYALIPESHSATHLTSRPLVLNSFVKGYILDKASYRVLEIPGIRGVVLNIGGDIVIKGDCSETVQIADPVHFADNGHSNSTVQLRNMAIATSGNYRRGYMVDGQWFSHIIDPRTSLPVTEVISASVIAPDPTVAGALATAFNVMNPDERAELAASFSGVEYQIVTRNGHQVTSPGWSEWVVSGPTPSAGNGPGTLNVTLELARFEGPFRRPFVAVWIENSKKESVRTLALWYNKPRWLPDLKRWYAKNQLIVNDWSTMSSVSSATRSPGAYTLTWDGLDANGKPLPVGTYTVYIEAAREHGTYQLIRQEIDWNGKPGHFDLQGGVEIASASVDIVK